MKARILDKSEEQLWSNFIADHPLATIHQSPSWGHFQKMIPSRGHYCILVLEEKGKILGGGLILRQQLPKGFSWLYCPRGPLFDYDAENIDELLAKFTERLENVAEKQNAIFLRIDPPLVQSDDACANYSSLPHFHQVSHGFQPQHTRVIDISKTEETILKQMKPKGRYNIRLAEKKGITVEQVDPQDLESFQKGIEAFYEILKQTTRRDGFHGHNQEFYENMVKILAQSKEAHLYLAKFEGETIAAILNTYFNSTATYYYGASSNQHRNLMAPYLLQWQAIRDAKEAGYSKYDLFGVAPKDSPDHTWAGVTQFKNKFGGNYVEYAPAQEFAFRPLLYWLYRLYKKLR
jgi:peptidoglycan pentaglycine glycine transferase (the first glycine)